MIYSAALPHTSTRGGLTYGWAYIEGHIALAPLPARGATETETDGASEGYGSTAVSAPEPCLHRALWATRFPRCADNAHTWHAVREAWEPASDSRVKTQTTQDDPKGGWCPLRASEPARLSGRLPVASGRSSQRQMSWQCIVHCIGIWPTPFGRNRIHRPIHVHHETAPALAQSASSTPCGSRRWLPAHAQGPNQAPRPTPPCVPTSPPSPPSRAAVAPEHGGPGPWPTASSIASPSLPSSLLFSFPFPASPERPDHLSANGFRDGVVKKEFAGLLPFRHAPRRLTWNNHE
ncbi:hypothetical protein TARUN_2650 [Trichoderma arundinaceum]|uniref:Uncharacterized protein n=1 Tax=Trichoderma arundinaceum TaxID=490622 RepID=A0A395NU25_TRIAR|nr:hypothetical protein TARUN_2650 [Trichoderma arundinaceum]